MKTTPTSTLRDVYERMELSIATRAGLSANEWHALSEHEKIAITERVDDSRAAKDQSETLEQHRSRRRRWIEKQERSGEQWGLPQWLRDARAKERPDEQAVLYLSLITEANTASADRLKEISRIVDANTGRGHVLNRTLTRTEIRELLLEEIERAGLSEWYQEAERQQSERANQ